MKNETVYFFSVVLLSTSAFAGSSYSVPELVERSLQRSDQIRSAQARMESLNFVADQAGAWSNPEVTFELGQKRVSSDQGLLLGIEASQPLSLFGKRSLRKEVARLESDQAKIQISQTRLEVVLNIVRLAYEYRSAKEKARFLEERNKRFELIRSYLSSHYFVSPQKKAEKELVENRLRSLTSELFLSQGQYHGTYNDLDLYAGFAESPPPDITAPWLKGRQPLNESEWVAKVREKNLSLAQEALSIQTAEKEKRLAQKDKWADFSLSAFYNEERAGQTERFIGGGLSMPLPLWNRNAAAVKSRGKEKEAGQYARTFIEHKLTAELKRLLSETEAARRVIAQYPETLLNDLEKQISTTEKEFRKGRIDLLTFLETEAEFSESYERALEAQTLYAAKIADLFTLSGEDYLPQRLAEF